MTGSCSAYAPTERDLQARLLSEIEAPAGGVPEIEPCPFDGHAATLQHERGDYGYRAGLYYVRCSLPECGAESKRFKDEDFDEGVGMYGIDEKAKAQAVQWWNRRPGTMKGKTQ